MLVRAQPDCGEYRGCLKQDLGELQEAATQSQVLYVLNFVIIVFLIIDKDDIFDKEVHQQRYIIVSKMDESSISVYFILFLWSTQILQELLYQTTSSVHDARKSSIQVCLKIILR